MYPNVMGMPNNYGQYGFNSGNSNQYNRLAQMEQQQQMAQQALANQSFGLPNNLQMNNQMMAQMGNQMGNQMMNQGMQSNNNFLKGRPVTSIDEARAAQIDFDGSMFIFTDVSNKKIYTKQINLDGTASLNTYALVEDNAPKQEAVPQEIPYVTKTEFEEELAKFRKEMLERSTVNEQQRNASDAAKAVLEQPAF